MTPPPPLPPRKSHHTQQKVHASRYAPVARTPLTYTPHTLLIDDILWTGREDGGVWIQYPNNVIRKHTTHLTTVTHILTRTHKIYTIDTNGGCAIWNDKAGLLKPNMYRIMPKISDVVIVFNPTLQEQEELWFTNGKLLEAFSPERESIRVANTNIITALAYTDGIVYIAVDDGKIIFMNAEARSIIGTVAAAGTRITAMCSTLKGEIWAGLASGFILVLAEGGKQLLKQWKGHNGAIQVLKMEQIKVGMPRVVSVSESNVYTWEAWQENDWIGQRLALRESEFATFTKCQLLICSWNVDSLRPECINERLANVSFIHRWLSSTSADLIIIGLQEVVDLESKTGMGKSLLKKSNSLSDPAAKQEQSYQAWQNKFIQSLKESESHIGAYRLLCRQSMVGLFLCAFAREDLLPRISSVSIEKVKTGLGGLHGNKGGIGLRMLIDSTSICFLNCHLAAGQTHIAQRNSDAAAVLKGVQFPTMPHLPEGHFLTGGDGSLPTDHEYLFFFGDLNYRIEGYSDHIISQIAKQSWDQLLAADQLTLQFQMPHFPLADFTEAARPDFAPTYKYDRDSDQYDTSEKKRSPAWCDRILYRQSPLSNLEEKRIICTGYRRHESQLSDHRPISASFDLAVKQINGRLCNEVRRMIKNDWDALVAQDVREQ